MLRVQDIHTYYGDSYILQGISIRVKEGEVIGLLGRNGMGKTTLIRSIIGFTPPRRGRVMFKDTDVTHTEAFPDRPAGDQRGSPGKADLPLPQRDRKPHRWIQREDGRMDLGADL